MYWNVGAHQRQAEASLPLAQPTPSIVSFDVAVGDPQRHSGGIDFLHDTKTPESEVATAPRSLVGIGATDLVLAVEYGVAERMPALTQTGLEVPGVLLGAVDYTKNVTPSWSKWP